MASVVLANYFVAKTTEKLPKRLLPNWLVAKTVYIDGLYCNIEHGSFTPLVFNVFGGCSPLAQKMLSQLANLISAKRSCTQSESMRWLRNRVCFALLKSALLCIRGTRRPKKNHL